MADTVPGWWSRPSKLQLMGVNEIADFCGVSKDLVAQWRHRGKLPEPDAVVSGTPVWLRRRIEVWARRASL